jgi:hypothetical protein
MTHSHLSGPAFGGTEISVSAVARIRLNLQENRRSITTAAIK